MKNLIAMSVVFLISVSLMAQDNKTMGGIKVGTTLPGTIHIGGLIDHSFTKNIGMVAEVLYNQKNVSLEGSTVIFTNANGKEIINSSELKYKMHYIQVPLSFRVTFGEKVKPYFMGGVAVSYLLSSSNNNPGKPHVAIETNNLETSYLASIGVDYKPVFIEVRYNAGINPAVHMDSRLVSGKSEFYNKNIMLSVGFKF